ncbi:hypothetical protein PR048_030883 [Dryococelus australis]|uniref:Uncharacterized protein n=1 Tax=Dryococelus australis TaxID=614101 RepID=A0ABQ9GDZ4_9NEOP|nr:hypothetical protein PR048_030883 [Dryococelus australis]
MYHALLRAAQISQLKLSLPTGRPTEENEHTAVRGNEGKSFSSGRGVGLALCRPNHPLRHRLEANGYATAGSGDGGPERQLQAKIPLTLAKIVVWTLRRRTSRCSRGKLGETAAELAVRLLELGNGDHLDLGCAFAPFSTVPATRTHLLKETREAGYISLPAVHGKVAVVARGVREVPPASLYFWGYHFKNLQVIALYSPSATRGAGNLLDKASERLFKSRRVSEPTVLRVRSIVRPSEQGERRQAESATDGRDCWTGCGLRRVAPSKFRRSLCLDVTGCQREQPSPRDAFRGPKRLDAPSAVLSVSSLPRRERSCVSNASWENVPVRLPASHQKANRIQSPPEFHKWESCRAMSLVGGFSRGSPATPALVFQRCSILTSFHPRRLSRPQDTTSPEVPRIETDVLEGIEEVEAASSLSARCGISTHVTCRSLLNTGVNLPMFCHTGDSLALTRTVHPISRSPGFPSSHPFPMRAALKIIHPFSSSSELTGGSWEGGWRSFAFARIYCPACRERVEKIHITDDVRTGRYSYTVKGGKHKKPRSCRSRQERRAHDTSVRESFASNPLLFTLGAARRGVKRNSELRTEGALVAPGSVSGQVAPGFSRSGILPDDAADLISTVQDHDGNTASSARRSDEALGVRVSVARIAPSLLDLGTLLLRAAHISPIAHTSYPPPPHRKRRYYQQPKKESSYELTAGHWHEYVHKSFPIQYFLGRVNKMHCHISQKYGRTSSTNPLLETSLPDDSPANREYSPGNNEVGEQSSIATDELPQLAKNVRSYRTQWLTEYKWLQYLQEKDAALCSLCEKPVRKELTTTCHKGGHDVFSNPDVGFHNWVKETVKFKAHDKSAFHSEVVYKLNLQKHLDIAARIQSQHSQEQKSTR